MPPPENPGTPKHAGGKYLEDYHQIGFNILETFPERLPTPLHVYREDLGRVARLFDKDVRLTGKKAELVRLHCENADLFVSSEDYADFATHLSKHLSALLAGHHLGESDAADIFYRGIMDRASEFLNSPSKKQYADLARDAAVFCEYMWADTGRWIYFFNTLSRDDTLPGHAVNTLFVGMAIYLQAAKADHERLVLTDLALAFLLHDLGMTQAPKAMLEKEGALFFKERSRIKEHVAIGVKMLNRLDIQSEVIFNCLTQHHERLNGSGYPDGLKAGQISLEARVCAVADAFSAMIADRGWREPINPIVAAAMLRVDHERFDVEFSKRLLSFMEIRSVVKDKTRMDKLVALARKRLQADPH